MSTAKSICGRTLFLHHNLATSGFNPHHEERAKSIITITVELQRKYRHTWDNGYEDSSRTMSPKQLLCP